MSEPIEQRVVDYDDHMESLTEKIKTDLADYVRDVVIAAWNSALSEATFEARTFIDDVSMPRGKIPGAIADDIDKRKA